MAVSEDVLRLVRTVERLPREDQDKILRIVDLLSLVPPAVQDESQRMLRELLAPRPSTKNECVAGVDDVIAYLESTCALRPASELPGAAQFRDLRRRARPTLSGARAASFLRDDDGAGPVPRRLARTAPPARSSSGSARRRGIASRARANASRASGPVAAPRTAASAARERAPSAASSTRRRRRQRLVDAHGRASCRAAGTCRGRASADPAAPSSVAPERARACRARDSDLVSRDAVFTMSPIARYSKRCSAPMLPSSSSPDSRPIRVGNCLPTAARD